MLTTTLFWVLLALVLLHALALRNPEHPLARCAGSLLLLGLLLAASLARPGLPLRPLLLASTAAVGLPLAWSLAGRGRPGPRCDRGYLLTALLVSLISGVLVALRPNPFEYPGDAVDYLNLFQIQSLVGPRDGSCLESGWRLLTYRSSCTLWGVLLQGSPLGVTELLSGVPQRAAIALPIAVLGLGVFRLLRMAGVGAVMASLYWLLILVGTGNQAIAFVVNHGLQGSALAAAVFLEAVMVLLALLGWRQPAWRRVGAVTISLVPFLYLQLRLHGAFALMTLVLLVPLLALLGLRALLTRPARPVDRSTAWLLLAVGLGLLALLLTLKTGWSVDPARNTRLVLRWRILEGLGVPEAALPASYMLRAPAARPELLAVASLLAGGWCLLRPLPVAVAGVRSREGAEAGLYREVASLFGFAIVAAFLLPPVSHLFLNLPNETVSNARLMWGLILVSPLPSLAQTALITPALPGWNRRRAAAAALLAVVVVLVVVPVPGGSPREPQLFWSKMRHLLEGPSGRVDLLRINRALMPSLLELKARAGGAAPVVLADELIASALQGFPGEVRPIDPVRDYTLAEPGPGEAGHGLIHTDLRRLRGRRALAQRLEQLSPAPGVVIQQAPIAPYYTPYAEILVYDQDAVPHIARSGVNALPAELLETQGFRPWRTLDGAGRPAAEATAAYRLWIREP